MSEMTNGSMAMPAIAGRLPDIPFTRLLLRSGETCRIGRGFRRVRVLSGSAWITCNGQDILVPSGECGKLPEPRRDWPVMSSIGGEPLAVELRG